jgi:predicted DNA-binding protein YlxM (UPF0122 family)
MILAMQVPGVENASYSDVALWLDFYSQLLTDRTREVLELHFNEDMSLSEMADHLGITRQAVHDKIRQGCRQLAQLESKLGLVHRFKAQKQCIAEAIAALDQGETAVARQVLQNLHDLL